MNKPEIATCKCGKKFTKKAPNHKYCSKGCKRKAEKVKSVRTVAVEKVKLPAKAANEKCKIAKPIVVNIHLVKPNDIIKFIGFSPERVLEYAHRLQMCAVAEIKNRKPVK